MGGSIQLPDAALPEQACQLLAGKPLRRHGQEQKNNGGRAANNVAPNTWPNNSKKQHFLE
jgi:hypothetical protein